MKITKEKWNSKAYRWISVIMVLLLVLAPVGVFGVRLNVDAADASQTYTGTSFTLMAGGDGVYYLSGSDIQEPININYADSGTIILNPVSGENATFSISSNVELPDINIVCSEGVSVNLNNNDIRLNSLQVSTGINLGTTGILRVHTANLNNTSGGSILLQDSTLSGNQTEYGSLVLTGTNNAVVVEASTPYSTISSEGGFTLKGFGGNDGINVPGPVSGQIGVWSGLWPYLDLSEKHFYEGAEYNLMNYFVAGADSFSSDNCTLEFRDEDRSSSIISTGMPRYTGNFAAIIISPQNNWYSEPYYFSITTFPGVNLIVSEVDEEGYVTVSAPEGYSISTDNEIFVSSIPYTEDQLYTDDVFDGETLNYYIRVESGEHAGAVSDSLSYSVVAPGLATADFHPQEVIIPDDEKEVVPDEEEEVVPEEEEKEEEPKEEEKKEEVKPADESGHSGKTDNTSNTTTVSKPSPNITLTLDDQLYGLSYAPSFKSDSTGSVKYLYSKAGENNFSEAKPTEPGKYVCRALQEGTDKFGQGTKDVNFSILYLAAPSDAYSISGKKGNNGYYVSDVFLNAPDGYSISLTLNGTYEDKVQVSSSEKTKYIYLKRKSDGAMTDGIGIKEGIKVDAKAPVVSGKATDVDGNEVALGGKIYSDKVSFKMADEHLAKVTVNGEEVTVTDGAADISLDANNRHMVYKISAEDEAGNVYTFTVNVYAPWMESGVIPAGVKVGLEAGSTYKLEEGVWATDVDGTMYTGGMDFYVAEDMEVTFIKVK
jgi:hypothetical protein